jgi:hypothetical protein
VILPKVQAVPQALVLTVPQAQVVQVLWRAHLRAAL